MVQALKNYAALMSLYLRPYRKRVATLGVLLLAITGLHTYNPQFVRRFIDSAQVGASAHALALTGAAYVGLGLVRRALQFASNYLTQDLAWRVSNTLRGDLAAHCLALDMPFHKAHTPGQLIQRIDDDVEAITSGFGETVLYTISSLLLLAGLLIALYEEDWRLGLALTLVAAVALGVLIRLRSLAVREATSEREASANLYGFIEERLTAIEDIRANGGAAYTMRRSFAYLRAYARSWQLAELKGSMFWLTTLALRNVGDVVAFALGAALLVAGRISLGTVYLVIAYIRMLFQPIEDLSFRLREVQRVAAGIIRVQELLAMRREILDGTIDDLPAGPLAVEFRDVSFTYEDGDQAVLHDLHLRLAPGTSLGLLGRTGSGKTTLSRLLFRLYDPTVGVIALAGVPLPELTLEGLHRRVGLVTQDVQLFQASVRDNLTLFDPAVHDSTLVALIHDVGLGEWFARLPQGLDTDLDAGGGGLSAGEAQLLAFARVFLKDPGLVVLDEPSSRLDPATERLMERAMDRLLRDRTAIIIAHRLGTVQRVDEIMIMEEGRVVEHGRRRELAANPESRFAHLLRTGMEESFA